MRGFTYALSVLLGTVLAGIGAPAPVQAAEATQAPADEASSNQAPASEQYRRRGYRTHHYHRRSAPRYYTQRHYYYPHRPYYSYRYYYSPPIVYSPPVVVAPAPPVVYQQPQVVYQQQPVVVQAPPPQPAPEPVVVQEEVAVEGEEEAFASINFRFVALNQGDTDLAFETIQGAGLMGVGGALRFDLDPHWMLEIGLDFLLGQHEDAEQISVPITLSAMAHLFPDSVLDPYGIAGLGIMLTEYDDPNYSEVEQYSQFMGHVGGGVEINVDPLFITSDVRFLLMQTRPERNAPLSTGTPTGTGGGGGGVSVRGSESGGTGGGVPTSGTGVQEQDPDGMSTAFEFTVGAGWRF